MVKAVTARTPPVPGIPGYADVGLCRPRYLAEWLGMTTAGTSSTIDRLSRADVVPRTAGADPAGHRAVIVALTAGGADLVDVLAGNVDTRIDALLGVFVEMSYALDPAAASCRRGGVRRWWRQTSRHAVTAWLDGLGYQSEA